MLKQHILVELQQFIFAFANHRGVPQNIVSPQLVQSSLYLLEDLPAARELVFEYFSLVFDVSVSNYVAFVNKDSSGAPPPEDEAVNDIQDTLENLVNRGPPAWCPLIASWSLELVGKLSNINWNNRKMDIGGACNLWLNCPAMRCLLGLIASCFRKLNNAEAEVCVGTLLATFRKYTPTFDWVVARLGGCFPLKIISQILQYGLKKYSEDPNSRFNSEIGILDYLSFAHENDLKRAMRELLTEGLNPKKQSQIIPYLLQTSNYSEAILQVIVDVFFDMYNDSLVEVIAHKSPAWMQIASFREMQPSLNNIALKLKANGAKVLLTCARLADKFAWCQDFLEYTLQELEQVVLMNRVWPLITDLATNDSKYLLWKSCPSSNILEQQTAIRLLLLISPRYPHIYHQTFSELLNNSYDMNKEGMGALIRAIGGINGIVDFPAINPGLTMSLEAALLQQQLGEENTHFQSLNVFRNLVTLAKLEKSNECPFLKHERVISAIVQELPKIMNIFESTLNNLIEKWERNREGSLESTNSTISPMSSKRIKSEKSTTGMIAKCDPGILVHEIVDLLNAIEAGSKFHTLAMGDIIKLSRQCVRYFFWSLTLKSTTDRAAAVNRALSLFERQCNARKTARQACLRELIEGGLFTFGYLFGRYEEPDVDEIGIQESEMLIRLNQRETQGTNSFRSVLHAGVIGKGLKPSDLEPKGTKPDREIQKLFLRAISACCMDTDQPNSVDGYSTVSLLLVEMVSTDMMYNGLPFPDEEFTKHTMERDLLIRRAFLLTPLLWALLGYLAAHRPALCFSSVLLRALCATCLHQWRAKNVTKSNPVDTSDELFVCTQRLLQILAKGQLLPPPLSNLHCILHELEPTEIAVVMKECVWNYLKDHVPSPALYKCDNNGLHWRNPNISRIPPQYVDTLRNIMQKKLPKLGAHYYEMFVMCELKENTNGTATS